MKKNLGFTEVKMLLCILENIPRKPVCISKLAKDIGISSTNPYFQEIIKELRNEDILETVEEVGNMKFIEIKKGLLMNFINEQEVTAIFYNYFYKHYLPPY